MSTTIECQTLVFGQANGMTAQIFAPGSDTPIAPDSTVTLAESTSRHGIYSFTAPTVSSQQIIGVYQVDLYLAGATKPFWSGWAPIPVSGTARCEDSYKSALVSLDSLGRTSLQTASISAVSEQLSGATIVLVSPLSADGSSLFLITGDSYTTSNGQNFKFNISGATNLVGTIPHLRLQGVTSDLATAPAVTSGTQQIVFNDVQSASTSKLAVGTYPYQIRFLAGSDVATVIQGYAIVKAGI